MMSIGGYFGLESCNINNNVDLFHKKRDTENFYLTNTATNSLLLLIKHFDYKTVFLPIYTCNIISESLKKNQIQIEYYSINNKLEIIDKIKLDEKTALIYTNYFGLKYEYAKSLTKWCKNLIIDNAQAFYCSHIANTHSIYSPRKFFGVPDGGLLITNATINTSHLKIDTSYNRFSHLLKNTDVSTEFGYDDFVNNDKLLGIEPIKKMSKLTTKLLSTVNYKNVKNIRRKNFLYLKKYLADFNELNLKLDLDEVPMVYPFLIKDGYLLRKKLIEDKIYTATYWNDLCGLKNKYSFESYISKNLIVIPIDQRYTENEMILIINVLKKHGIGRFA